MIDFFLLGIFFYLINPSTTPSFEHKLWEAGQKETFNWETVEHPRDDALLQDLLISIDFERYCPEFTASEAELKAFHFMDINSDGREDLIYEGSCGSESVLLLFLQDEFNTFSFWSKNTGKLTEITKSYHSTYLFITQKVCCCLDFNSVTSLEIPNYDTYRKPSKALYYHSETELPAILRTEQPFETLEPLKLRIAPQIDDVLRTHRCFGEPKINGNVVNEYQKGARGIALEKRKKDGETWYFVILDPHHVNLDNNYYYTIFVENYTYNAGWVKAEALKFL